MAQFLKVKTLAAGAPEVLIPIAEIAGMVATATAGNTNTMTITMRTRTTAAATSGIYVIVVAQPLGTANQRLAAMYKAFNDAITANPGGIVSTVMPPLTVAQAPLPQTGSGRQPITVQALYTQFTSCVFTP